MVVGGDDGYNDDPRDGEHACTRTHPNHKDTRSRCVLNHITYRTLYSTLQKESMRIRMASQRGC